jgi:hypothetical protein
MLYQYNDGGREAAGFRGKTGDCVTRAIAIATKKPYREVYDDLTVLIKNDKKIAKANLKRKTPVTSPRDGVDKHIIKQYLDSLGWHWKPLMGIGTGCRVHLRKDELPKGRLIVSLSRHLVAVLDGVLHDTYDSTRDGERCVYGYWYKSQYGNRFS